MGFALSIHNSLFHATSITRNTMADNDMSFRQRAVIEFHVKRGEIPAAEIYQRLQRAYGILMMALMIRNI
jgi:hypothetical protein